MLSYSHHKKEIKNLSYDGLFLYFWKQEVWDDHKKNGIQEGDYSAKRGAEKAEMSLDEFEKAMSKAGYKIPEMV